MKSLTPNSISLVGSKKLVMWIVSGLGVCAVIRNRKSQVRSSVQSRSRIEVKRKFFSRVAIFAVLLSSFSFVVSPTVPASAAVPPDGTYECSSGIKDAGTPAYTITNGQIDNQSGRLCSGPLTIAPGVTGIASDAFLTSSITSVVIPNTVIRIEPSAFDQSNLSSITFESESQLNYIGWFAFYGTAITQLTLPNSLQTIDFNAFKSTQLNSLTIPDSIVSLGEDVFAGTSSLSEYCYNGSLDQTALEYAGLGGKTKTCVETPALPTTASFDCPLGGGTYEVEAGVLTETTGECGGELVLHSSVATINGYALQGFKGTKLTIPATVLEILGSPFAYVPATLTAIDVDPANQNYSSIDGVLFDKNATELIAYPSGKSDVAYTIPATVERMRYYGFAGPKQYLTIVSIPDTVIDIGDQMFYGATGLTTVAIGSGVSSIGVQAFVSASDLTTISVSDSNQTYTSIDGVLYDKSITQLVAYPAGKADVTYIAPNTVTSTDYNIFAYSGNLITVDLSSIAILGGQAFEYPSSIEEIIFGDELTALASNTIIGASSLKRVTFGSGLTTIGENAFTGGSNLSCVIYTGTNTSVQGYVFPNNVVPVANSALCPNENVSTPTHPLQPAYYPFGPQLDVSSNSVLNGGWELCWSGPYNGFAKFSEFLSDCTGEYILYTGWEGISANPETIPDTFAVLAAGPRSEVFRDTTNVSTWTVTEANGSYWSFGDDRQATGRNAVGFSDASTGQPPLEGSPCFDGALSICWHSAPTLTYWDVNQAPSWGTDEAGLSPGWSLNGLALLGQSPSDGGANYTRAIFQSASSAGGSSGGVDSTVQSNTELEKAAREVLIAEAQVALNAAIAKGETITIQLLRAADLFGATNQNITAINADIALLSAEQKQDFMAIRKVVIKHATVDAVASKRTVTFSQLVETGITTQQEGVASSVIMRALSALPGDQIDTVAKINKAITEALAAHQMRKDRIKAVSDRTAARNLG
jgi:hypothetical protein